MNKHFDDSRYYLRRAGEHAKLGVNETLEPHLTRIRELIGRGSEPEPEPDRLEAVLGELTALEQKAEGRVRGVAGSARETLSERRSPDPSGDQ